MQSEKISVDTGNLNEFYKGSHFWGRITLIAAILVSFSAPLYMFFVVGAFPGWDNLISGIVGYAGFIGILWVLEPITYFPILGTAGTYIAFLSGNISNLALPCSAAAQEAIGAEAGSKKAEISGVLGISIASLVNKVIVILTVIGGTFLIALIPDSIKNAFDFVLPAIFGGVLGQFSASTPLYGMLGLAIGFIVLFAPIFSPIKVLVCVILTVTVIFLIERRKEES